MFTKNFPVEKTVSIAVILICAMIFFESVLLKRNAATVKKQESVQPKNSKVCKTVMISEMQQALVKSNSKKIILNIYPIKASPDSQKTDFSVLIKFGDSASSNITIGKKLSSKKFMQGSFNYIKSLKENNIPEHLIPFGYYIEMNAENVKTNLELCMSFANGKQVSFDKHAEYKVMAALRDSCKCPPTCPCPPTMLAEASSVKKIIKNVYAKE